MAGGTRAITTWRATWFGIPCPSCAGCGRRYDQIQVYGSGRKRQVVLYQGEDGYWVAECPSLPGCVTQGRTREDALANAKEAVQGYVAALVEDHLPVPEDRLDTLVVAI